jgi:glycosyltransferase involved in cell wall biosynthesis
MCRCAVVIPTLNEGETVEDLIHSLFEDAHDDLSVVVVDGGSSDGTRAKAKSAGATVLREDGEGRYPAAARNQGAEYATSTLDADVLCFLDGDLTLSNDFVATAMNHFVDDEDVVAVKTVADTVRDSFLNKTFSPIEDRSQLVTRTDNTPPPPPVHFVRSDVFSSVGGFPPLGFREDWILTERVLEYATDTGGRVVMEPECVRYGRLDSLGEYVTQQTWYGRTYVPYLEFVGASGLRDLFVLRSAGYVGSLLVGCLGAGVSSRPLLLAGLAGVVKLLLLVFRSVRYRAPYVVPHLFLAAIGNLAFVYGIVRYIVGDHRLSRGE